MSTSSKTPPAIITEDASFIGIDYHKKYSIWHAVDAVFPFSRFSVFWNIGRHSLWRPP